MKAYCLNIIFLLSFINVTAQYSFNRVDSFKVIISGDTLAYPWAGGLNLPQFSEIDIDGNGVKDLFIFDRSTNKISTYLNLGIADSISYEFAPQYISRFPQMQYFALLVDYNCDGKEDIFTYSVGLGVPGIAVYRNDYDMINGLKFTLVSSVIYSQYGTYSNLYLSPVDIPAITDIDNDGDIDILTFGLSSLTVEYHRNYSIENYGVCDSLEYELETNCWGFFQEGSITNKCTLNISCKGGHSIDNTIHHAGSTLLAVDLDKDSDKELILGDLSYKNMVMLINGGDSANADIIAQDTAFPVYNIPVDLSLFPIAFYLDINNDDFKDLIVAPNASSASENFTGVWYYKNVSPAINLPDTFIYQQNSLFQDEMIEVGEGPNPVFFDYNSDGLLDLIIGNYGYYSSGNYTSNLSLYENIGNAGNPKFELVTRDYAGISALGLQGVCPSFGDMDGDGDSDMLIGDFEGKLHYFENSAGAGNTANFTLTIPNYFGIDVGDFSTPQIIDVNRDGKLDIIIGERSGILNYCENVGTTSSPFFLSTVVSNFGGVNVKQNGYITGYSFPYLFDEGGVYKLLVASERGFIYYYENIDGNLTGSFTLIDTLFGKINEGLRASIGGSDINNDAMFDLIVGNYAGGVSMFIQGVSNSIIDKYISSEPISIFPNPTKYLITINLNKTDTRGEVFLYNNVGQSLAKYPINESGIIINTTSLSEGMYFCKIILNDNSSFIKKLVIQK